MVISETWFVVNTFVQNLSIDGYKLSRNNRHDRSRGGVALYISDQFEATVVDISPSASEAPLECIGDTGR